MTESELVADTVKKLELRTYWFFQHAHMYSEKPMAHSFLVMEVHRFLEWDETPEDAVAFAKYIRERCKGTFPGG